MGSASKRRNEIFLGDGTLSEKGTSSQAADSSFTLSPVNHIKGDLGGGFVLAHTLERISITDGKGERGIKGKRRCKYASYYGDNQQIPETMSPLRGSPPKVEPLREHTHI